MLLIRTCVSVLLAAGLCAAAFAPAYAQGATIGDAHAAIKVALDAKDFPTVWQQSHAIMELAAKREAATLTGPELYAIAVAHYYLVAETLDQALKSTGLSAEQVDRATAMRDRIMGVERQPDAAAVPAVTPATPTTPPATPAVVAKVRTISHGQQVKLEDYAVPGKSTIFDFFSEYCPPCRALSPRLEKLVNGRADLMLVKVDINRPGGQGIDWQSPVAKQFKLQSIPHLKVYGPDGKLQAEGDQAYQIISGWLNGGQ